MSLRTPEPAAGPPAPTFLNNGSFMRLMFLLEAIFNIVTAVSMILAPNATLSVLVPKPHIVTTTSASLYQWLGALILGLTPPLLLVIPDGPGQVTMRKWVYMTFVCGETCLAPMMAWQATAVGKASGLEVWKIGLTAVLLGALLSWRIWVLGWRAEWFGGEEEEKERKDEKKVQ